MDGSQPSEDRSLGEPLRCDGAPMLSVFGAGGLVARSVGALEDHMHTPRLMIATGSLIALAILGAAGSRAALAAPASLLPGNDKTITFFSDHPLAPGERIATASLPTAVRAQLTGEVSADASHTPRGYELRRGNLRTDYLYVSAYVWAIEGSCNLTGCKAVQQVRLQLFESIPGKQSKRWTLTMYATPWSGPSYFALRYYYECGVNIKGARDETCSTWRHDGADGHSGPADAYNAFKINRSFGSTPNVTKFPMVNFLVTFRDGSHAVGDDGHDGEKFRGWDVCVKKTATKMCKTTGTGA
jgi:hypothetical protein